MLSIPVSRVLSFKAVIYPDWGLLRSSSHPSVWRPADALYPVGVASGRVYMAIKSPLCR